MSETTRRSGDRLIEKKGGNCLPTKVSLSSVWLAIFYLFLLALYPSETSDHQGGCIMDCYEQYAVLILFFAIVGVFFFFMIILSLAWDLLARLRK